MFTGIVETTGRITRAEPNEGHLTLTLTPDAPWTDLTLGESVAVNGACLTVTGWSDAGFTVDLSQETLAKTAPRWTPGALVNLERAMRADARFGGHIVSGHVDGVGEICALDAQPGAYTLIVRAPERLARYFVPKGSVTVDGVSLTVVDVGGPAGSRADLQANEFTLWLVPHTLDVTAARDWTPGARVNLEADQLAKYVERLIAFAPSLHADAPGGRA
ncbi:riboflavin synthase [Deinococcus maricopensis]|uniref:Riboflavin synthase n=1 Tax=Deinococcus maricopensis (strain DSM 21211 / LMG 22137 / NRRL B-23946 / LB-34) TaxID=709986 RepID=E8UBC9_DEIML|nr:riboflavin synthase [Deinococcus maricopensis]ADV68368.1 riboflavin synthase, alpha subunit [Deinococcus maricopensis DSM 21211]